VNVGTNGLICMQICVCRLLSLYWDGTGVRFLLYLICGGTQCRYARICTVQKSGTVHSLSADFELGAKSNGKQAYDQLSRDCTSTF
jgi:hypothetical protein